MCNSLKSKCLHIFFVLGLKNLFRVEDMILNVKIIVC
jgi:hypothetical protein